MSTLPPDTPDGGSGEREPTRVSDTPQETSTGMVPLGAEPAGRFCLLAISDRIVATYALPDSGYVIIGRAPKCDVVIDDPSVSRQHAELSLGPPITLRDLGSSNGSRVREQRLVGDVPVELVPGEGAQIGQVTLIVQRQAAPLRTRRLWTHDYFEVRVEEQCSRGVRNNQPFAIARLRFAATVKQEAAREALVELVRGSDVIGEYGPDEFEILLLDSTAAHADQAINRLVAALAARGLPVEHGRAHYPEDGRSADELLGRAAPGHGSLPAGEAKPGAPVVSDGRMRDLYRLAERVAAGDISVLILGETGAGKEVLAAHVHSSSPRKAKPYLKLNCGAFSETLLESELFGHERGAFTGAVAAKPGLLETADGGTVFLDEIGEMPMALQVKLLRVLEDRAVMRVGGLKSRPIDIRFIAATNRDLELEIGRGLFRKDLFYRLNGATLVLPPLRERVAEIPELAAIFVQRAAQQLGKPRGPVLTPAALDVLRAYSWPGNIRELRNVLERAVLLCGGGAIEPAHLPLEKMRVTIARTTSVSRPGLMALRPDEAPSPMGSARTLLPGGPPPPAPPLGGPPPPAPPLGTPVPVPAPAAADATTPVPRLGRKKAGHEEEEKRTIEAALAACAGNQTQAAQLLGVSRRTLINRIEELGIVRPRKGKNAEASGDGGGDETGDG